MLHSLQEMWELHKTWSFTGLLQDKITSISRFWWLIIYNYMYVAYFNLWTKDSRLLGLVFKEEPSKVIEYCQKAHLGVLVFYLGLQPTIAFSLPIHLPTPLSTFTLCSQWHILLLVLNLDPYFHGTFFFLVCCFHSSQSLLELSTLFDSQYIYIYIFWLCTYK